MTMNGRNSLTRPDPWARNSGRKDQLRMPDRQESGVRSVTIRRYAEGLQLILPPLTRVGFPLMSRAVNQQSVECGWPAVNVSGGDQPSRVSFLSESRPFVIVAADGVSPVAIPDAFTAFSISTPPVQACAPTSLQASWFLRKPGSYLSNALFILWTAGLFAKNGRMGYGDQSLSLIPAVVARFIEYPLPCVT